MNSLSVVFFWSPLRRGGGTKMKRQQETDKHERSCVCFIFLSGNLRRDFRGRSTDWTDPVCRKHRRGSSSSVFVFFVKSGQISSSSHRSTNEHVWNKHSEEAEQFLQRPGLVESVCTTWIKKFTRFKSAFFIFPLTSLNIQHTTDNPDVLIFSRVTSGRHRSQKPLYKSKNIQ